jgi:predicted SAM-dependent methyltransferase
MSPQQMLDRRMPALFNKSWLHLGDYEDSLKRHPSENVGGMRFCRISDPATGRQTYFMPFWYDGTSRLPFKDETFTFVFSEHFIEHLFLDQACELLKECFRMLRSGGCLRVAVPDADLRVYQGPEPAGFTTGGDQWTDPGKHKSRWSIYSLQYVLEWIGFECVGIVYCDREGNYVNRTSMLPTQIHRACLETELVTNTDYVARLDNSLVINAIRR